METHVDAFCWGILVSCLGWGFAAGWFYYRYRYSRACLVAMLFVFSKAHLRGVYFAPYDIAVVNVAVDFINRTK
jgi:hypothetical protein